MPFDPMRYMVCEFSKMTGNCKGILARFRHRENAEQFYNEYIHEFTLEDRPLIEIVDTQDLK